VRSAIALATLLTFSVVVVAPAWARTLTPGGRVGSNRATSTVAQSGAGSFHGVEVASSEEDDESSESWDPKAPDPFSSESDGTYERIGSSGPVYERPARGKPFNSAFDRFYRIAKWAHRDVTAIDALNWSSYENLGLATRELYGFAIFNDPHKGHCSACHTLDEGIAGYPLFTDFAHEDLGVLKSKSNHFYWMPSNYNHDGTVWVDPGPGTEFVTGEDDGVVFTPHIGDRRVPSLRNIGRRPYSSLIKSYTHDGYFKSLTGVVYYYDTREVAPWLTPRVRATANTTELGNLGLTRDDEHALVAFMRTLSDE
jgi:cytochrome c peroxidase